MTQVKCLEPVMPGRRQAPGKFRHLRRAHLRCQPCRRRLVHRLCDLINMQRVLGTEDTLTSVMEGEMGSAQTARARSAQTLGLMCRNRSRETINGLKLWVNRVSLVFRISRRSAWRSKWRRSQNKSEVIMEK